MRLAVVIAVVIVGGAAAAGCEPFDYTRVVDDTFHRDYYTAPDCEVKIAALADQHYSVRSQCGPKVGLGVVLTTEVIYACHGGASRSSPMRCELTETCRDDGCDSVAEGARSEFEKDDSCPAYNIEVGAPSHQPPDPPAEVAADGMRLQLWKHFHPPIASGRTWVSVRGCGASAVYVCKGTAGVGRSIDCALVDPIAIAVAPANGSAVAP